MYSYSIALARNPVQIRWSTTKFDPSLLHINSNRRRHQYFLRVRKQTRWIYGCPQWQIPFLHIELVNSFRMSPFTIFHFNSSVGTIPFTVTQSSLTPRKAGTDLFPPQSCSCRPILEWLPAISEIFDSWHSHNWSPTHRRFCHKRF